MVKLDSLSPGVTISFESEELYDQVTHVGTIEAIGKYSMASRYGDVVARYQSMRKQKPTMDSMEDLTYFVFSVEQDGKVAYLIMAKDWIKPSSVAIIEQNNYFDIRILDRNQKNDGQKVLDILRENGFACKLVKDV